MPMWWNSSQNTTLNQTDADQEDAEYWERARRADDEARQRQEQYERLVAEGYYD